MIKYSDNYSDTSVSLCHFKRDEVSANNADLTDDSSQSFKYKAALVGKKRNAFSNTNSSIKKHKNCCSIKVSNQLLEIVRNSINQLQNSFWIKLDLRLHFI